MGYSANGKGSATIKNISDTERLREALDKVIRDSYSEMEYDIVGNTICLWEYDSHWDEEDTMEILNALSPYITEGSITYDGDENCHWRYNFINGKWVDENGILYYNTQDMINDLVHHNAQDLIEALKKEGYKIEKIA